MVGCWMELNMVGWLFASFGGIVLKMSVAFPYFLAVDLV
jgi:hypothetical protein